MSTMEEVTSLFTSPVEGEDVRATASQREAHGDSPRGYDESAVVGVSEDASAAPYDNARGGPSEGAVGHISPARSVGSRGGSRRSSPVSSIASIQSAARLEELRLKLEIRKMEIEAEERRELKRLAAEERAREAEEKRELNRLAAEQEAREVERERDGR